MFQFKQFSVDQSGCAMKINTDGVLLGAFAAADAPANILDIGTGTGVIALMLAQRYNAAKIDAVEIDEAAAQTSKKNFGQSPFADRLTIYPLSFENYFDQFPERKYDLIVSNPPFYINSLKSPGERKTLAKHANMEFFERLIKRVSLHLKPNGCCWLILPVTLLNIINSLANEYSVYPQQIINIRSFEQSTIHRVIICFGSKNDSMKTTSLNIYEAEGVYSDEYKLLLKPYFTIF